jgi:glyoxalase family protein
MALELGGIHHLSGVTAKAKQNLGFYTGTLGMRLVKKTVNQDDVTSYHLFYGDGAASPGSDLTFFDFPAAPEHHGTHAISRTGLRVAPASLGYWKDRLTGAGVEVKEVDQAGRKALWFSDAEGQRLAIVDDGGEGEAHPWDRSTVPAEHQIRGLGPIVMSVPDIANTETVLTDVMNMRKAGTYPHPDKPDHTVHVFEMGPGGAAAELHVAVQPDLPPTRYGAGGVHHVAFRVPDKAALTAWAERIQPTKLPNSGVVERYYFRSFYFREPNGILFELATDGPGFTADEPLDRLGETLALPPFLEPRRAEIEAGLKPL